MSASPARSPLGLIFLTILIDMIGFGIMIPVLPVYAHEARFGATEMQLGFLVGIYSLLQVIFSPLFGKISDRIGRKPVLVFSIFGTAIGFVILGAANTLWMLFLGRIIDGISGGNIATAQTCIADVTTPEQRSKSMALIGVAFGLGFIIGPALGGVLGGKFGVSVPFYVAAGLALCNALLVLRFLPETHGPEHRVQAHERTPLREVFSTENGTMIATILVAYLASIMGFSMMTSLFALFNQEHFGYDIAHTGYILAYVGVLGVLIQGGLVRRLLKRPIEKQLAMAGAGILALSMFALPLTAQLGAALFSWSAGKTFLGLHLSPELCALLFVCIGIALGNGFITPTLNGLVSKHTGRRVQGRALGLMQSAGSLARFIGPILAFWLLSFDKDGPQYARIAFWVSGTIILLALILVAAVSPAKEAVSVPAPVPEVE
ncbi:MAG: tetA [Chthoniobacteraceae bacterium]|nr:tetA [Chthoniobacteraceae bacterium]